MLTAARPPCPPADQREAARRIRDALPPDGLFADASGTPLAFRIAPTPFPLPADTVAAIEAHGRIWLKFLKAAQTLYLASLRGDAPAFVAEYLDAGKPDRVRELGRMNRFRSQFPVLLRPDLLVTDDGLVAAELDSVPGGFGLLACLDRLYAAGGFPGVGWARGGPDPMVRGFARAMAFAAGTPAPATAIVVSAESGMYRPEMAWLAAALRETGADTWMVAPETLRPDGEGLAGPADGGTRPLDVVYRFFELFDLPNVPQADAMTRAAKLKRLRMTAPPKAFLEEKVLFALLHHPALAPAWEGAMGEGDFGTLRALAAPTWALDPRPVPPHAVIAGLVAGGRPVPSWESLGRLSQRDRAFVVKPSGFSPAAWGSHGVRFAFDLPQEEWRRLLAEAPAAFATAPHVIQTYRRPALVRHAYWDPGADAIRELEGRVRLTPYYFVTGEERVELGGILATICPPDKKAIHGMPDAIMTPCLQAAPGTART